LIGEDTPSEDYNDQTPPEQAVERLSASSEAFDKPFSPPIPEPAAATESKPNNSEKQQRDELFPSSLRARHAAGSVPADVATASSSDAAVTSLSEKLMSHHRTEQESLTSDLLSMAQALKESSKSFSRSLEDEDADI
jgi:hypothetical protein